MSRTVDWMPTIASSLPSMSAVAFWKERNALSVCSRGATTLSSFSSPVLTSGPADLSRSSWSFAARLVACSVISVRSFMLSSWSTFCSELEIRIPPSVVAAMTGSARRETRRVLMRQLRRATRGPRSGPPSTGPWG